jgi:hypothetical protein
MADDGHLLLPVLAANLSWPSPASLGRLAVVEQLLQRHPEDAVHLGRVDDGHRARLDRKSVV